MCSSAFENCNLHAGRFTYAIAFITQASAPNVWMHLLPRPGSGDRYNHITFCGIGKIREKSYLKQRGHWRGKNG